MRLAYGTYALPDTPLDAALATIAAAGFEGVEFSIGPRHTVPADLDAAARRAARARLADLGLTVPAFMVLGSIHAPDDATHQANLERFRAVAALGRDLGVREPPVIAIGFGGRSAEWPAIRDPLAARLADYGRLATELDVVLACEAHCGAAVDRSDRAVALLDQVSHPRVRLHFDIVHFFLAGEAIVETVARLVPYTAHTHVTDCQRHADGHLDLRLVGDGEVDCQAFVAALAVAGWDDFVTLEVSTMVWSRPDFDPVAAARQSYRVLDDACRQAGVPRP